MNVRQWSNDANLLADLFRRAYREFIAAFEQTRQPAIAEQTLSDEVAKNVAQSMLIILIEITERLGRGANERLVRADLGQADALRYAFVAIIDEILLNTEWQGKAPWRDQLLEDAIFQTRISGERLFERIHAAMRVRNQECLDIAEVYLHCLNLGFRGKYRDLSHPQEILGRLRKDLFYFIYQRQPDLQDSNHVLIEAIDQNVIRTPAERRSIANKFRWYLYVLGILSIPFAISCLLWGHVYMELNHVIASKSVSEK